MSHVKKIAGLTVLHHLKINKLTSNQKLVKLTGTCGSNLALASGSAVTDRHKCVELT